MKPYRMRDGREIYALAPWEGSAFQALGLELSMAEPDRPSWRQLLEDVVDVEIDYAARESCPDSSPSPTAARASSIPARRHPRDHRLTAAPDHRRGLALHPGRGLRGRAREDRAVPGSELAAVSTLLTDHGPWEGFNTARHEVIRFQTSAHTFSLILGLLGTASDHMKRYLDSRGPGCESRGGLPERRGGRPLPRRNPDLRLGRQGIPIQSTREQWAFHVKSDRVSNAGIALVSIALRRREPLGRTVEPPLPLRRPDRPGDHRPEAGGRRRAVAGLITTEIFCHFADTAGGKRSFSCRFRPRLAWRRSRRSSSRSGRIRRTARLICRLRA